MRLHKIFSVFLIFVMIFALTACGKNDTTDATNFQQYHGEGQTQGGIKSDDEISALQEEERNGTAETTTEDENNDQPSSEGTPATSETVDASSYWEGDNFFDIVRYAEDNNCVAIWYYDTNGNMVENNNSGMVGHAFFFRDWMISVSGSSIRLIYTRAKDENGNNLNEPAYSIIVPNDSETIPVSHDNSAVSSRAAIDAFITIVNAINSNPGNQDPLNGTGLTYMQ